MLSRKHLAVVGLVQLLLVCAAVGETQKACQMRPPCLAFSTPEYGLTWCGVGPTGGQCDTIAIEDWVRQSGELFDVLVAADGPGGSGRFWHITVGIAKHNQAVPQRGFCFQTTTAGWRTLREFDPLPLPWVGDRDADGWPELILWDSFPLYGDEQMTSVGYGLMAWVYEVNEQGDFVISWEMSRELAFELSSAYRSSLSRGGQEMRDTAADYIEAFATKSCEVDSAAAR
jgi:hypothetical protein